MRRNTEIYVMLAALFAGVIIGSASAVGMDKNAAAELNGYLTDFFNDGIQREYSVFISSFFNSAKIFLLILLSAHFKLGAVIPPAIACCEGFVSGFTAAALARLFGICGFLVNLAGAAGAVLFLINIIFYGAYSIRFSLSEKKRERSVRKKFIVISIAAITIFCIASLIDGYITTIFMKIVVNKM